VFELSSSLGRTIILSESLSLFLGASLMAARPSQP
jgi:hypothetical protein